MDHMDYAEIFNIPLDLSAIYLLVLVHGCRASFVCNCHSILEGFNLFSGVELSIRLFCFITFLVRNSDEITGSTPASSETDFIFQGK